MTTSPILDQHKPKARDLDQVDLACLDTAGLQLRAETQRDVIADYAARYELAGPEALPPIVVYRSTDAWYLADGHHRVAAARKAGLALLPAVVKLGDRRDALLYAACANGQHGARLTPDDKRKIVTAVLADDEWRTWSDSRIAEHCHVGKDLVAKIRKTTGATGATRVGKDGKARKVVNSRAQAKARHAQAAAATEAATADNADLARLKDATALMVTALTAWLGGGKSNLADIDDELNCTIASVRDQPIEKITILCAAYQHGEATHNLTSRTDLAELCGFAPDVHPGQLSRAGLLYKTNNGYELSRKARAVFERFLSDHPAKRCPVPAGSPPVPASQHPADYIVQPGSAKLPQAEDTRGITTNISNGIALRRFQHICDAIARSILANPRQHEMTLATMLRLLLVIGFDCRSDSWEEFDVVTDETIRDVFFKRLASQLSEALADNRINYLPDFALICRWYGIDHDALVRQAAEAHPDTPEADA